MPNFKPALISAVGQGNTIDVFAVSLEVNFAGGLIMTMDFENGGGTLYLWGKATLAVLQRRCRINTRSIRCSLCKTQVLTS
jgi:hypothetical protein